MNRRLSGLAPVLVCAGALSACSGGSAVTPSTARNAVTQPQNQSGAPAVTESIVSRSLSSSTTSAPHIVWTHIQKRPIASSTATVRRSAIVNSPFNLTYFGGALVKKTVSNPIYVNCASTPAACWGSVTRGSPGTFLARLAASNFIHILDQYEGTTANNRYTLGTSANLTISGLPHVVQLSSTTQVSIAAIVHAVASAFGTGYGHVYHVFLPKGTDTCMGPAAPNVCYSPDNPANFIFCAYHGSADFADIGHVLFSVEPYQGVVPGAPSGCADTLIQAPHGTVDIMASTLSHETFEAISDPDGSSWFNRLFLIEIGDECVGFHDDDNFGGEFFDVQEEYSNAKNGCVNGV